MTSLIRFIALVVIALTPLAARAQTSTLQPFTLSGKAYIQAKGETERRVPSSLMLGIMAKNSAPYAMGASMASTLNTAARELSFSGQAPRDLNGTLLEFYASYSNVTNFPPYIAYQNNRIYYEAFPTFTAPATGNLTRDFAFVDLCSLTVEVQGLVAGEDITYVRVEAESGPRINSGYPVTARAEFSGLQVAGTNPKTVSGFISTSSGGRETAQLEALVGNNRTYKLDIYTTITGSTTPVKTTGSITLNDGNCTNARFVTQVKLPQEKIGGSYWLKRDNSYAAGPSVSQYAIRFASFNTSTNNGDGNYSGSVLLAPTGDAPVNYSVTAHAGGFWVNNSNSFPRVDFTWPDGRGTGQLHLPAGGEHYTPTATSSTRKGVYPDGTVIVSADEVETVSFQQDMAYLDGEILINGCAKLSDVQSGNVSMLGIRVEGTSFTNELGQSRMGLRGSTNGSARTPVVLPSGLFQLIGVPGAWSEGNYDLTLNRPGTGPTLDGYLNQRFHYTPINNSIQLRPFYANVAHLTRDIPMGAVTVNLRVQNPDGSLRPFHTPKLDARYTHTAGTTSLASVFAESTGRTASSSQHQVTILGAPGIATINASAQVPANPDGSGAVNTSNFPPLTNVRFRAPRPGGECAATCAVYETNGWNYYDDDRLNPRITLDRYPDPVRSPSITFTGTITDESPVSMTVNGVAATITGTPPTQTFSVTVPLSIGTNGITFSLTDRCGGVASNSFKITRNANNPPRITVPAVLNLFELEAIDYTAVGTDADNDPLTYAIELNGGITGLSINPTTGRVTLPAGSIREGTYEVWVSVTDGIAADKAPTKIVVSRRKPARIAFIIHPQDASADQILQPVTVGIYDANGVLCVSETGQIKLSFDSNPTGATLGGTLMVNAVQGVATWNTLFVNKAGIGYTLLAQSSYGDAKSKQFNITAGKATKLDFIVQPSDTRVHQNVSPAVQVGIFDSYGNIAPVSQDISLTLSHPSITTSLLGTTTVLSTNGISSFSNLSVGVGGVDFQLDASSGSLSASSQLFDVIDAAPVISLSQEEWVNEGEPLSVPVSASDADGDTVVITVTGLPEGASFDPLTGLIEWTPDFDDAGDYTVTVTATSNGVDTTTTLTIHVVDVNRPPVLAPIGPKTVYVGNTVSFETPATDPDGDTLSYSATPLPTGAVYSDITFTWSPELSQLGTHTVKVLVNDGRGGEDFEDVEITVLKSNDPPLITPLDEQETDGPGGFTFEVMDPDGDAVVCRAENLPKGAVFDDATRRISWAERIEPAGRYTVTITCSDGALEDSTEVVIRARVFDRVGGGIASCSSSSSVSALGALVVLAFALRRRRA